MTNRGAEVLSFRKIVTVILQSNFNSISKGWRRNTESFFKGPEQSLMSHYCHPEAVTVFSLCSRNLLRKKDRTVK